MIWQEKVRKLLNIWNEETSIYDVCKKRAGKQHNQTGLRYKRFSIGKWIHWNGVANIVTDILKQNIIHVSWVSNRIVTKALLVERHGLPKRNFSAFAQQFGWTENKNDEFFAGLEVILLNLDCHVVLSGDLNGHLGNDKNDLNCHGGYAYANVKPIMEPSFHQKSTVWWYWETFSRKMTNAGLHTWLVDSSLR